jgi:hypothetical protein
LSYNTTLAYNDVGYTLLYVGFCTHVQDELTNVWASSFLYGAATNNNYWDPISELKPTDADLITYFLAQNAVAYVSPVLDPWFFANGTRSTDGNAQANSFITVLSCLDRARVCNPSSGTCTPFGSSLQTNSKIYQLNLNAAQYAAAQLLLVAAGDASFAEVNIGLGDSSMIF